MGEPYAGVEVGVLTDVPLVTLVGIGRSMVRYGEAAAGSDDEIHALRVAWALFADDVLTGWNLYDRRGAVPPDASAFGRLSPRLMVALLGQWADMMTEVPDGE